MTLEPVAGFQGIFGSQTLNQNILRLRSSTKQKEYKKYKEYEEFKEAGTSPGSQAGALVEAARRKEKMSS